MGTKFSDFMKELEEETRREGPEAVAAAADMEAQFKLAAELILLRKKRSPGPAHSRPRRQGGVHRRDLRVLAGDGARPP